jgi:hypothetical protein
MVLPGGFLGDVLKNTVRYSGLNQAQDKNKHRIDKFLILKCYLALPYSAQMKV